MSIIKYSRKQRMLSINLLTLSLGLSLFSINALAANCRNLAYNVDIDIPGDEINVSGKKIGDVLFNSTVTRISGECSNVSAYNGYNLWSGGTGLNSQPGDLNAGIQWDSSGVIRTFSRYGRTILAAKNDTPHQGSWLVIPPSNSYFYLRSKPVGRMTINLGEFYHAPFTSTIRTSSNFENESLMLTGNYNRTISVIYTPSCSASVNDVVFPGSPTASAIVAGTVTPQTATVNVSCNDILPKYTVKVSSPNGTQGNATDGVIKSNNASVGYRLSWKEGQVASVGSNIQLDSVLTPATQPTTNTFNLPISVKPVALVPLANVTAGPASSAIKIDLTFN